MGSNQSTEYGHLHIQTEKSYYLSGETINGNIYMNLIKDYPGNIILLKFIGKEFCKWEETTGSGEDERTIQHIGESTFYKCEIPIYNFPGYSIPFGHYIFPFNFVLTNNLPGSLNVEYLDQDYNDRCFKAYIKYEVIVECVSSTIDNPIEHSQNLIIKQSFNEPIEARVIDKICPINTFWCFNQGSIYIKSYFNKNIVTIGETVYATAEIDNTLGKIKVNRIHLQLNRIITLKNSKGTKTREMRNIVYDEIYQGVEANERVMNINSRVLKLLLENNKENICSTTYGNLISCRYLLEVICEVNGCICCVPEPLVEVPIIIYAVDPSNFPLIKPPENWNPQIFSPFSAPFNTTYQSKNSNNQNPNLQNNMQNYVPPNNQQQNYQMRKI